jgi:hypothetical protein
MTLRMLAEGGAMGGGGDGGGGDSTVAAAGGETAVDDSESVDPNKGTFSDPYYVRAARPPPFRPHPIAAADRVVGSRRAPLAHGATRASTRAALPVHGTSSQADVPPPGPPHTPMFRRLALQTTSAIFAILLCMALVLVYLYCRAKGIGNLGPERQTHVDTKAATSANGVTTFATETTLVMSSVGDAGGIKGFSMGGMTGGAGTAEGVPPKASA